MYAGPVIVMPFIDSVHAMRSASFMAKRAGARGLLLAVHDDAKEGFVRVTNRMFRATESPYFGYVAQDAFPGRYWLKHAIDVFKASSAQLVALNDGKWFGALAAYGLARREWASRNYVGAFFHEAYRRHYADAELSVIAAAAGALGYSPHSVLVEIDWNKDARPVDRRDRKTFRARAASRFDGRVHSAALLKRISSEPSPGRK